MTEKEKMLAGEPYNSRDPELLGMYHRARKLMQAYNSLDSELLEKRQEILEDLLGSVGSGVWIEAPLFLRLWEQYFYRGKYLRECQLHVFG